MSSHNDSFVASGSSPTVDFLCENHGSVFLLTPVTLSAQSWIEENLPSDAQWFGNGVKSRSGGSNAGATTHLPY
jgi:hypothetical protein